MKRTPILIGALALAVGALGGCTALPGTPPSGPSSPSTPAATATSGRASTVPAATTTTSATPSLVTCADLVTPSEILAALHGPNSPADPSVTPVSTAAGSLTGEKAIEGAGGLSCAWRVGPVSRRSPIFEASVLPGAADDWTAYLFGDGPIAARRTFAGVSAAAACGDPGCGASAAVGSSWVRVDLLEPDGGQQTTIGVFGDESEDTIFAHAQPAIESVFHTVQHASAAQLRFPSHLKADPNTRCTDLVAPADLAKALGVDAVHYDERYQSTPERDGITGAALTRIKAHECDADGHTNADGLTPSLAGLTILPRQAWAVDDLVAHPDQRGDLQPTALRGQRAGEHALTDCTGDGTHQCDVVLSLADFAVEIDGAQHALRVAEAVVAAYR